MTDDAILRIRVLQKTFGDNHVLRGMDLDVKQGDCIAILGASGPRGLGVGQEHVPALPELYGDSV